MQQSMMENFKSTQQTAMQDLIDHIKDRLIAAKELEMDTEYIENILENAINSLPVEKKTIDDAYLCGLNRGVEFQQSQEIGVLCEWPSDRDYYQENFNTEEK